MPRRWRLLAGIALALALGSAVHDVLAAPEEIQVYMDDLTEPGGFGTDLHNNYVVRGSNEPDYAGAQAPNHVYRFTPEFYYGLADRVELGLYVLTSVAPSDGPSLDGAKVRIKYIAPHDEAQGAFWGANLEVGRTDQRFAEQPWNTELKGIYGFRAHRWTFALNANFDWSLSAGGGPATAQLGTKLTYLTGGGYQLGFESYNDLGPVRSPGRLGERSQMLYGVIDAALGGVDLNVGLGHGLTSASDDWVLKFIVGLRYR